MREHKGLYLLLIALCIGVIGLSVGYAALSTELRIVTGKVTSTVQLWKVAFANGTVNGVKDGTSDTGLVCGSATVTDETVTINDSILSKPGDTCTYHLTVNNTGSIDAKLSSIVLSPPTNEVCSINSSSMVCGDITYLLATDSAGTTLLTPNKSLAANTGTLDLYLVTKYTSNTLAQTEKNMSGASFTLTYAQQ